MAKGGLADIMGNKPKPPDGTEGIASVTLKGREDDVIRVLYGCVIRNNQQLMDFIEDDTCIEKFFVYFYSEGEIEGNVQEAGISIHRFTKPEKPKYDTVQFKDVKIVDKHVFLPLSFKYKYKGFLTKHSKKVSLKHPSASDINQRYKGVTSDGNGKPMKWVKGNQVNWNDGPLLFKDKLIGWCSKEGNPILFSANVAPGDVANGAPGDVDNGAPGDVANGATGDVNNGDQVYDVEFAKLCGVDSSVKQDLCGKLDKKSYVVSYYQHLADQLNAPLDVKARCNGNRKQHSCTFELFSLSRVPGCSVNRFLDILNKFESGKRNDVIRELSGIIKDEEKEKTIREVFLESEDQRLMEYLQEKLDIPRGKIPANWYKIGLKFKIDKDRLDLINNGGCNPTERLLVDYAYKVVEADKLTVGWLRRQMDPTNLDRDDVVKLLNELQITVDDTRSMKEVFEPGTDAMWKLCALLNRCKAPIKGWKNLAHAWRISHEIYKQFEPSGDDSPTEILLEWLSANNPQITVREICDHLESIKRIDARDELKKKVQKNKNLLLTNQA